jgi:hypothetical protein
MPHISAKEIDFEVLIHPFRRNIGMGEKQHLAEKV